MWIWNAIGVANFSSRDERFMYAHTINVKNDISLSQEYAFSDRAVAVRLWGLLLVFWFWDFSPAWERRSSLQLLKFQPKPAQYLWLQHQKWRWSQFWRLYGISIHCTCCFYEISLGQKKRFDKNKTLLKLLSELDEFNWVCKIDGSGKSQLCLLLTQYHQVLTSTTLYGPRTII